MNSAYEDGDAELAREVEADKAAKAGNAPVVPVDGTFIGTAYKPAQGHLHTGARWERAWWTSSNGTRNDVVSGKRFAAR